MRIHLKGDKGQESLPVLVSIVRLNECSLRTILRPVTAYAKNKTDHVPIQFIGTMKGPLTIAGMLLCLTFTGCTGSEEPEFTRDQSELQDKKERITNIEYRSEVDRFREEAADRVADNERNITVLYEHASGLKPAVRKAYGEKIRKLENQNKSLKTRMDAYKANDRQDWRQFRFEFETDMDQLVESIKALGLLDKTMPL